MFDSSDESKRTRLSSGPVSPELSGATGVGSESRERLLKRLDDEREESAGTGPLTWADLGFLAHGLAFAARPLHKATAAVTERHSLGPRGAWILNLIAANIDHPHELADVFQIGRSLVTAELTRLTEAGLVVGKPGRDRRRTDLMLTEEGLAALAEVRKGIEEILRAGLAGYDDDEVRLCARMLTDLRNSVTPSAG